MVLTKREIGNRLSNAINPVIFIHKNPDGDTIGTAAALAWYYQSQNVNVSIIGQDPIPKRLEFLVKGLKLAPVDSLDGRTLISVDVASPAQLGAYEYLANEEKITLMIDHHEKGVIFADNFIIPGMSSCGEVLYSIFTQMEQDQGKCVVSKEIAFCLFSAISSDTGCFRFSNASPETLRAAANLMEYGIDTAEINHALFESKSNEILQAEALSAKNIQFACGGKIAYVLFPYETILSLGNENFETAIDIIRSVEGVEVAFVVKGQKDNKARVSIRSTKMDVSSIAQKHNGGGHIRAAGCSFDQVPLEEIARQLIQDISDKL